MCLTLPVCPKHHVMYIIFFFLHFNSNNYRNLTTPSAISIHFTFLWQMWHAADAFLRFYKEIKWFCAKHLRLRELIVSLSMIKYMWNEHISMLLLLCYLNGKTLCQSIQMGKHSGNTNRKQSIHMGNSWHKWESTQSFNINGKALIQSIQMGKHSVSQYKWESTQSHISLVNK